MDFGRLFRSRESSVYQWERGLCIPRLVKLMNISVYFGVSLDCLLCGKAANGNATEKALCAAERPQYTPEGTGQVMRQFIALPRHHKERLIGYLDALSKENGV